MMASVFSALYNNARARVRTWIWKVFATHMIDHACNDCKPCDVLIFIYRSRTACYVLQDEKSD